MIVPVSVVNNHLLHVQQELLLANCDTLQNIRSRVVSGQTGDCTHLWCATLKLLTIYLSNMKGLPWQGTRSTCQLGVVEYGMTSELQSSKY